MKNKRIMAALLTATMLFSSVMAIPKVAKAAETVSGENGIEYILDDVNYNFVQLYKNGNKTAPVKEGYVFGGWYKMDDSGEMVAYTEATAEGVEQAYAKFVPSYVLSIKAQNEVGTTEGEGSTSVRIISSVDSRFYKKVGFEIYLNNKKSIGEAETTNVYSALKNTEGGDNYVASNVFGAASAHFSVWRLDNINHANYSKIIYARPYWITLDGTKVDGLAKYVHIEDEYKDYISVPINLVTGEPVAAGIVELIYDASEFQYIGFEAGRLLPEMYANAATSGSVKIIGNASEVDTNVNADGIYGNVRFRLLDKTNASGKTFTMNEGAFCNWSKEDVTVTALDVTY